MEKEDYVFEITSSRIRMRVNDNSRKRSVKALGGRKRLLSNEWTIKYKDDPDLVRIVNVLSDIGVCFVASIHGWPPSTILEELKDKGLLESNWKEIVWVKKGEYQIRNR